MKNVINILTFVLMLGFALAGCPGGESENKQIEGDGVTQDSSTESAEAVDSEEETQDDVDVASDTDKEDDVEVDSDSASMPTTDEEDGDTETEATQSDPMTAYFLVDSAFIGNKDQGCDLTGNGRINNNLGELIQTFVKLGNLAEDPNSEIREAITSGKNLIVLKMTELDELQNEDQFVVEEFKGEIDGFTPGEDLPPEDLFSGQGSVNLEGEPLATFDDASIENQSFSTGDAAMVAPISVVGKILDVELAYGRIEGDFTILPDGDMLNGRLENGYICGAIDTDYLMELLSTKAELKDPVAKAMTVAALRNKRDVPCGDKLCISVAVAITAVSVDVP